MLSIRYLLGAEKKFSLTFITPLGTYVPGTVLKA